MNESVAVRSIEQISGKKQRLFLDNGEVWVLYRGEIHTLHLAEGADSRKACEKASHTSAGTDGPDGGAASQKACGK